MLISIPEKVTVAERTQALGHESTTRFNRNYISRISAIDGQSLFLGENPDIRPINHLRSAARCRIDNLPQQIPAQVADNVEDSQEMIGLRNRLAALSPRDSIERKKIYELQGQLRNQALRRYQEQWLQDNYAQTVSISSTEHKEQRSAHKDFEDLRLSMPERARLADKIGLLTPCYDERRKNALQDLIRICSREDQQILYRPNEYPEKGHCPVSNCQKDLSTYVPLGIPKGVKLTVMISLAPQSRSSHIHGCRQFEMLLKTPSAKFCYRCVQWFQTFEDWKKHCEWHLCHLDTRCEVFTYRHTLIIPGTCPFCIGCCEIAPASRFHQWLSSKQLWDHVCQHLEDASWPMICPHPLCRFEIHDREWFSHHMVDKHGKTFLGKTTLKRKHEDEEDKEKEKGTEKEKKERPIEFCEQIIPIGKQKAKLKRRITKSRKRYAGESVFLLEHSNTKVEDALADASAAVIPMSQVQMGCHSHYKKNKSCQSPTSADLAAMSADHEIASTQAGPAGKYVPLLSPMKAPEVVQLAATPSEPAIEDFRGIGPQDSSAKQSLISYCGVDYAIEAYQSEDWAEGHEEIDEFFDCET